MLGVGSMRLIHERIERDLGAIAGWIAVIISIGLCAIGVVIGRFQSWSSCDLVTQPRAVVAMTLHWVRSPFANHQSTGVARRWQRSSGWHTRPSGRSGPLTVAPSRRIRS
jgi:hypothetical protein